MNSKTYCSTIDGLFGKKITIETHISGGYPSIKIIGIPPSEGLKTKERVVSALKSSKLNSKPRKTRINVTPEINNKEIKQLDLPIALSLILAYKPQIFPGLKKIIAFGELGLDGEIKNCKGTIQLFDTVEEYKNTIIVIPYFKSLNLNHLPSNIPLICARTLEEAVKSIKNKNIYLPRSVPIKIKREKPDIPFNSISQLYLAKKALLLSVTGRHHLLIAGSMGIGKTILLNSASEIFPELSKTEQDTTSRIQNILYKEITSLNFPIEKINSQTTEVQLNGGQRFPHFGISTKASNGLLIAHDIAEFPRHLLLALKDPVEIRQINQYINKKQIQFPTKFTLLASTNLCKCGRYGNNNRNKPCKCTPAEKNNYLKKIPETLLNRIDLLHFITSKVKINQQNTQLEEWEKEVTAEKYLTKASRAKEIQLKRHEEYKYEYNSQIPVQDLKKHCILNNEAEDILKKAEKSFSLNCRDIVKILRVARTSADLEGNKIIRKEDLLRATSYRTKSLVDLIEE